jgi:hypothetical protein
MTHNTDIDTPIGCGMCGKPLNRDDVAYHHDVAYHPACAREVYGTDFDAPASMPACDHFWAWVSPAGTSRGARICQLCHSPDPDWLNHTVGVDLGHGHPCLHCEFADIRVIPPAVRLALMVIRLRAEHAAEIVAAEQRGREDNADHSMCYVFGSKALEALIASERADAVRKAQS